MWPPISQPPSNLPPHPIPLGCPWAPALGALLHASNFHWLSILHMVMATHSSILAWKIPWRAEPGRLQSMGSLRVGHDWETSLPLFTFMHWRRKWQPTPVFLPGESQEQRSLVGCCLWGSHRVRHDWSDLAAAAAACVYVATLVSQIIPPSPLRS